MLVAFLVIVEHPIHISMVQVIQQFVPAFFAPGILGEHLIGFLKIAPVDVSLQLLGLLIIGGATSEDQGKEQEQQKTLVCIKVPHECRIRCIWIALILDKFFDFFVADPDNLVGLQVGQLQVHLIIHHFLIPVGVYDGIDVSL